jgi:hypothetical protein
MRKKLFYSEPWCEDITALGVEMICQSPSSSGNEGTQDEPWTF